MRQLIKDSVERLIGRKIQRFGKTFAFVSSTRPSDAWFSYSVQLENILRTQRINLVIDAGANEGQFGERLREIYSGDLLSFEPVSAPFGKLSARALKDPKWQAHNVALGSEEGSAQINISAASVFSSLLKANDYSRQRFGQAANQHSVETVRVCRLEQFLAEVIPDIADRRILLKMDTQGFDTEVFKGVGAYLPQVVAMQSEMSLLPIYEHMPTWIDAVRTYENAGFAMAAMFPVNWDGGRVVEYDCLMVRAPPRVADVAAPGQG